MQYFTVVYEILSNFFYQIMIPCIFPHPSQTQVLWDFIHFQQSVSDFLQNGLYGITKQGKYYKTGLQLLQNGGGITERGSHYKMGHYNLTISGVPKTWSFVRIDHLAENI